jgi:hypothetical protein
LVGDEDGVVLGARYPGGDGRSPPVGRLDVAAVDVVLVGEDRASHRTHQDAQVLYVEISHRVCYDLVQDPVAASRTVMGGRGCEAPFPLKDAVKSPGMG